MKEGRKRERKREGREGGQYAPKAHRALWNDYGNNNNTVVVGLFSGSIGNTGGRVTPSMQKAEAVGGRERLTESTKGLICLGAQRGETGPRGSGTELGKG